MRGAVIKQKAMQACIKAVSFLEYFDLVSFRTVRVSLRALCMRVVVIYWIEPKTALTEA